MKPQSPSIDFREVQRFNQWWLWAIVAGLSFAGWWAFVEQILMGNAWGNNPAPDAVVIVMWLALGIGLPFAMRAVRLVVRVSDGALHVRFIPFRYRIIPLQTIASANARKYRPIREYMGWGIRWMPGRGWVYSISGDEGVQLVLGKRRKLLIGSRKPAELAAAINAQLTPGDDGPGGGGNDFESRWSDEEGDYGERASMTEDEPLFESTGENGQAYAANGSVSPAKEGRSVVHNLGAGLSAAQSRTLGAGKKIRQKGTRMLTRVPTLGTLVRRLQDLAMRFGKSERVQRFADNPKAHAAEAGRQARVQANRASVQVKEHAVHVKEHAARAKEHAVRAKQNAGQQLREAHLPDRVAEPARRYLRNPQLIVDDLKKTG